MSWRVGSRVPINVYDGDRPVCQCQTAIDAKMIVAAINEPNQKVILELEAERDRWNDEYRESMRKLEVERDTLRLTVHSVTFGDLPANVREAEIWEGYEWDNMNPWEQRDATLRVLSACLAQRDAELRITALEAERDALKVRVATLQKRIGRAFISGAESSHVDLEAENAALKAERDALADKMERAKVAVAHFTHRYNEDLERIKRLEEVRVALSSQVNDLMRDTIHSAETEMENAALRKALEALTAESSGFLALANKDDHGNTNMSVLRHWIDNAKSVLSRIQAK